MTCCRCFSGRKGAGGDCGCGRVVCVGPGFADVGGRCGHSVSDALVSVVKPQHQFTTTRAGEANECRKSDGSPGGGDREEEAEEAEEQEEVDEERLDIRRLFSILLPVVVDRYAYCSPRNAL